MRFNQMRQRLPPLLLALLAALVFTGCRDCYVINQHHHRVTWKYWNEGFKMERVYVTNADTATFEKLELHGPDGFARDKSHIYLQGRLVIGADPKSFRDLKVTGDYYRDATHVFRYVDGHVALLPGSDPDSFKTLTSMWARDRRQAYFFEKAFVPRDIETFEPLIRLWARDSQAYYLGTREITEADRNSFHISETESWFATDHTHVFWFGHLIEGCDSKTFHITSADSGFDDRFIYKFENVWEAGVDIEYQKIKIQKQPLK